MRLRLMSFRYVSRFAPNLAPKWTRGRTQEVNWPESRLSKGERALRPARKARNDSAGSPKCSSATRRWFSAGQLIARKYLSAPKSAAMITGKTSSEQTTSRPTVGQRNSKRTVSPTPAMVSIRSGIV